MLNEIQKDSAFLVTNASGRHINLLNDNEQLTTVITAPSPPSSEISDEIIAEAPVKQANNKKKYHCTEPGCTKSFTTSGHLARHNRIHTGEKNFPCLFPGCLSRFSRQDNMMQHYRTHMSPKSKRAPKKIIEDTHPRPKLHAHQRIRSDPYQTERPLTIDQHLSNYRQSLLYHTTSIKYDMPQPLGAVAASHMQKQQQQQPIQPGQQQQQQQQQPKVYQPLFNKTPKSSPSSEISFYQHKPLYYSKDLKKTSFPFTLLHPTHFTNEIKQVNLAVNTPSINNKATTTPSPATDTEAAQSNNEKDNGNNSTQSGLLQLAHIVSTFG